ncbi:MAG: type IV toxin-antitoxin system AbiEi family antitoxin domain-containing protein [Acidimicrobiia bacterium]
MSNFEIVTQLAAQQYGVFATQQLIDMKIPRGSIHRIVSRKIVQKVARGVFIIDGFTPSWHQLALIKVLSNGRYSALSHESALINLGLLQETYVSKRHNKIIDFHVTYCRNQRNGAFTSSHRTIYPSIYSTSTIVNKIPQVQPECALIDSARFIPEKIFSYVFDNAMRNNLTTPEKMSALLKEIRVGPGRSKLLVKKYLYDYFPEIKNTAKIESTLESHVAKALCKLGINHKLQHEILCFGNLYRLDAAIPEHKIAIETDGFAFHRDRKTFDSDRQRQNDLVTSGWTVLRFTSEHSSEDILKTICTALGVR